MGSLKSSSKKNKVNAFESLLWTTADKLRGNLDAADYKHVALKKEKGADPEDRDKYLADNIFWTPPEAI